MDTGKNKNNAVAFQLRDFIPYRLAILSLEISRAFTPLYQKRFNLSRQEWRILAALGEEGAMSIKALASFSTLEKMQVSRAVRSMQAKRYVTKVSQHSDRREKWVKLTEAGKKAYNEIIPLVLARQQYITSTLSSAELIVLDKVMTSLTEQSQTLQESDG